MMTWWWWLFVDRRRRFFTNLGSEIRVLRDLRGVLDWDFKRLFW